MTPPSHRSFRQLWLPPHFLAPCFITLSVVSFAAQLFGILFLMGITTSNDTSPQQRTAHTYIGMQILRAGLMFQMAIFGGFIALGIRSAYVSRRWAHVSPVAGVESWKIMVWMIRGVCTIISVRPPLLHLTNLKDLSLIYSATSCVISSESSNSPRTTATAISPITSGHYTASTHCQLFVSMTIKLLWAQAYRMRYSGHRTLRYCPPG